VTTYTSRAATANNTNPIVLDAAGRTPSEIWLNGGVLYKFVLKSSTYVQIGTYDSIPAINDTTSISNLITVAGTNALTALATPTLGGYAVGAQYNFIAQNTNTAAMTIDIDTLGVKSITKLGSLPLVAGDVQAGALVVIEYDGTQFQMLNALSTNFKYIVEPTTIAATASTGTINYDISTQSIVYYTTAATANWTMNFRSSSSATLNSLMSTGQTITVTFMATQGATAYYNSAVTIDGASVTPKWQSGITPNAGSVNSVDTYTYAIIKTGNAAFTVLASQTRYA
ncbi:hypothetical protein UFOVP172_51, partial [uncultured Caudovirales phage]